MTHSTAEINGQLLVKGNDDPYNKVSNSVNIDINPINEQTIKGEVDDSSKLVGDSPLFNRFGSDPDKIKQEVEDSSKVIGDSPLFKKFSSDTDMEVDDLSKIGDNSPPLKILDVVGRQVMRSDGVYVDGSIQGIKVIFTADTGAARTVISSKLFRKIPNSKKPRLEKSSALASVNGQPLTEMGKAVFNITLGNLTLDSELIVAEIEDEALLGLDILMKGKGGPTGIKLTEGLILLDGIAIPCTQIGQPEPVRKITAADDFIIPPRSEVIIDVFVDKFHSDNLSGPQNYLLEPNTFFVEKYPVAMASCLVDISHEVTNKVRLMNPFDHEVEIRQDTVLGEAEKVECPPVSLFAEEDCTESNNFDNVKRIKLAEQKLVTWPTNVGIIRNITRKGVSDGGKSGIVPIYRICLIKDYYDLKSNLKTYMYEVYDKVWYIHETRKEGISPKLQPLYTGPCLITQKLNCINYEIQLDGQGTRKIVNHDKLKPYNGDQNPNWMKLVERGILGKKKQS